jgi:hypothetical protein
MAFIHDENYSLPPISSYQDGMIESRAFCLIKLPIDLSELMIAPQWTEEVPIKIFGKPDRLPI